MRKSPALILAAALAWTAQSAALADGVFFVPVVVKVKVRPSSDAQRALIVWRKGIETLHVQSTYRGPAADFAWVIPVPARPTVKRSDWRAFSTAEKLTRPEITVVTGYRSGGFKFGCSASAPAEVQSRPAPAAVRVLETLEVRELEVKVLAAADGGGLVKWLVDNGYAVDGKARPVLDAYAKKGFFFVVARIREAGTWRRIKVKEGVVSGALTPLAITFKAARPFYPLAISAISSAYENELLLVVAADKHVTPVEYAHAYLTAGDIAPGVEGRRGRINLDLAPAVKRAAGRLGKPALITECVRDLAWKSSQRRRLEPLTAENRERPVRVTRFHAVLRPAEMKDVTFVPAARDYTFEGRFVIDPYGGPRSRGSTSVLPGSMLAAGVTAAAAGRRKRKGKRRRLLWTAGLVLLLAGLLLL